MLAIQKATRRPSRPPNAAPRIGIAIAGGGPIGGMFELGALRAIDDALDGVDLTRLEVYVGVSSGAILAASLANGISTEAMCRIFLGIGDTPIKFRPETFLRPAFAEYGRSAAALPRVLGRWLFDLATQPRETAWTDVIGRLGATIPNGIFDNEVVERFLRDVFETAGRSNDFRALERKLYVVAVALDTGAATRFGAPGFDHVPISRAVQASAALPGLYPPVEIDGIHYVDGALRRTLHASVAMEQGVDLVIALNPLVPFDAGAAASGMRRTRPLRLTDAGLPTVLSQTFRTLLKSRMQVGLEKYQRQYGHVDLVLFEPDADDAEMFFTNIFSFHSRAELTAHAYRQTLSDLRQRRPELTPILARHGIRFRSDVIDDLDRDVHMSLGVPPPKMIRPTHRLRRALDDLEHALALDAIGDLRATRSR